MMTQKHPADLQRTGIYLIAVSVALFFGSIPACYVIVYVLPHSRETEMLGFIVYMCAVLPMVPALFAIVGAGLAIIPVVVGPRSK